MYNLADKIKNEKIKSSNIAVYWLGGTSYVIKSPETILGLDLYLSDACKNEKDDFKRLVPSLIEPEDIVFDFIIATHDHGDHFDTGSIDKMVNKKTQTKLVGPESVMDAANKINLDESLLVKLGRNEKVSVSNCELEGVFADHGTYSLDCIGIIIKVNGKNIYFTSDTCYRPDLPELIKFDQPIDLLIVPINGKFGNPDSKDASYITAWVKPKVVIPTHFWLFKEHGGDPGTFVEYCMLIAPDSIVKVPAIGEGLFL
jgi:L-ascorbate 6-phosphate lactonase